MRLRSLVVAWTLLLPALAAAQSVQAPRLHTLDNGLRVLIVEDPASPIVAVTWSAHVGDSAEPLDFTGNSHYLEHLLLFRGTKKYPKNQIGEWIAGRGGYFNGHTWYDYTTFEIMVTPGDLDEALDRHEQMMFHADFSREDFDLEKKAVFEELRSGYDRPYGYLWMTAPYDIYPGETFYSRSTIGTIEAVEAVTPKRVRDYYRDYYVTNNMTLAIVGDVDADAALHLVKQRFSKYQPGDVPEALYDPLPMKPGVNVLTEERAIGKAYFLMALPGPRATSPDWFPFVLLTGYLERGNTSLLRDELITQRELLDELTFQPMPRRFPLGWQAIDGEGPPAKLREGIEGARELLARVAAGDLDDEMLELARRRLLAAHATQRDDIYQVASRLVEADAHGDYRIFADYAERLGAVTRADVQAVARKYLTPDRLFIKAIFPEGETPADFATRLQASGDAGGAGGSVHTRTLDSGATLLHETRAGAAIESFTVAIHAGDRDDPKPGTAWATATLLARRTENKDRRHLRSYLDENGFQLGSWTTADGAFFSLQLPAGSTRQAGELLCEILARPGLDDEEFEIVRPELLARLDYQLDQPASRASDALTSAVFGGTAYGASLASTRAGITELSIADLRRFWDARYRAGSLAVAYCGGADADEVAASLAGLAPRSGEAPTRTPVEAAPADGVERAAVPMEGKSQANLYLAWPSPPLHSDDQILWKLAQKAIGGDLAGRLWKLRQEEGLAYSVWLSASDRRDYPLTHVYMATAEAKRDRALAAIDREVRRAVEGLSAEELDRVKVSYLGELNRLDRTAARRSGRLASWWTLGFAPDRRERLARVIDSATLAEVNRVVADVLDPERYHFAEAGAVPE